MKWIRRRAAAKRLMRQISGFWPAMLRSEQDGSRAGEYISLLIDDPSFAYPIRANLFHLETDSDVFHLSWTRPSRSENRDKAN
jgi:uncharacterized protein (DUF736 family)